MSSERETLAKLKKAWARMLSATEKETFDIWAKEVKELEHYLYQEKRKMYIHFRNNSEEYREARRQRALERKKAQQKYNHEYYLKNVKPKRAKERRIKQRCQFNNGKTKLE